MHEDLELLIDKHKIKLYKCKCCGIYEERTYYVDCANYSIKYFDHTDRYAELYMKELIE